MGWKCYLDHSLNAIITPGYTPFSTESFWCDNGLEIPGLNMFCGPGIRLLHRGVKRNWILFAFADIEKHTDASEKVKNSF